MGQARRLGRLLDVLEGNPNVTRFLLDSAIVRVHQRAAVEIGGKEQPGIYGPHARTIVAREFATPFMALRVSTIRDACSAIQDQL